MGQKDEIMGTLGQKQKLEVVEAMKNSCLDKDGVTGMRDREREREVTQTGDYTFLLQAWDPST